MTPDAFARSALSDAEPPSALAPALQALWWARHGDWERAHALVQDGAGRDAALVHAFLHRQEGDEGNARYWYRRAGQAAGTGPLDAEWTAIAAALLGT